jgi:hypothetical protein
VAGRQRPRAGGGGNPGGARVGDRARRRTEKPSTSRNSVDNGLGRTMVVSTDPQGAIGRSEPARQHPGGLRAALPGPPLHAEHASVLAQAEASLAFIRRAGRVRRASFTVRPVFLLPPAACRVTQPSCGSIRWRLNCLTAGSQSGLGALDGKAPIYQPGRARPSHPGAKRRNAQRGVKTWKLDSRQRPALDGSPRSTRTAELARMLGPVAGMMPAAGFSCSSFEESI